MFSLLSPQFLAGFGAKHSCLIVFGVTEWGILRPVWGITRDLTTRFPGCVERWLSYQGEERRGMPH